MSGELCLHNRQRLRRIDLPLLRRMIRHLLLDLLGLDDFELGVSLVAAPEMSRLNAAFLHHPGSTDVITFNYADPPSPRRLRGEIVVCLDEASSQARRFRTSWQAEVTRYIVHGVLHLQGYDDLESSLRQTMKREEARLLSALSRRFALRKLQRKLKPPHE